MIKVYVCGLMLIFFGGNVIAQDTQGFFLDDFAQRTAIVPSSFDEFEKPAGSSVQIDIDYQNQITPVSKYLFGNNANIFMTQAVDQPSLVDYITKLSPNVLRFPGGNLSSVFFWNAEKNQPPADAPAQLLDGSGNVIDAGYWFGKNTDSWTMSVDNYYQLLSKTNSTGIITINYGYARYSTASDPVASAAHLAADWVRYDNGRTKFWEIGNESNGNWQAGFRIKTADNKDGQPAIITGEIYGKHFKVFADSMRKAAAEIGAEIRIGAQLLAEAPASWWNDTDINWDAGVFQQAADVPDFYIIHSYYTPYATNSSPADILTSAEKVTKDMIDYVVQRETGAGVTVKPLALTEWNIFAEGSKQQTSFINGMHAAIVLGELIKNKYGMASRWDLANGWSNGNDHGMFNPGDEPGGVPKWNPRAVFYYMYYFQKYFGDHLVASSVTGSSDINVYASSYQSGEAALVVVNKGATAKDIQVNINGYGYGDRYYLHSLTGGTDNGQFSPKVSVNGQSATYATGGPVNFVSIKPKSTSITDGVRFNSPAKSVQYILIEKGEHDITGVEGRLFPREKIQAFPNPTKGSFTINAEQNPGDLLKISDSTGRVILEKRVGSESSTTVQERLSPGIYTIEAISMRGRTLSRKIVIH